MTYDIQGEVDGRDLTKDAPLAIVLHSLIDGQDAAHMARYQVRATVKAIYGTSHNTIILCQPLTKLSKVEMGKHYDDNEAETRATIAQTEYNTICGLGSLSIALSLAIVPSAAKASVLSLSLH